MTYVYIVISVAHDETPAGFIYGAYSSEPEAKGRMRDLKEKGLLARVSAEPVLHFA